MAICKMCHKMIPDGRDFCDECEMKRANQADESYLDRLLSSVSSDSDPEPRRRRDEAQEKHDERPSMADIFAEVIAEEKEKSNSTDDGFVTVDAPSIDEPVAVGDDLVSIGNDEPVAVGDDLVSFGDDEPAAISDDPISIGDDEPVAVGDDLVSIGDDEPVEVSDDLISVGDDEPAAISDDLISIGDDEPVAVGDDLVSIGDDEPVEVSDDLISVGDDETGAAGDDLVAVGDDEHVAADDVSSFGDTPPSEIDSMITDLLSEMPEEDPNSPVETLDPDDIADIFSQQEEADEPALSFDETEMVDPFGGDISPADEPSEPEIQFVNPGDEPVEENVLGADELFALDDSTISEQDFISIGGDDSEPIDVMAEIESGAFEDKIKALDAPEAAPETKKKKKSLFSRLFGNVVEELTEEQKEERRRKAEEEEKQKAAILETKKKNAEEAKAAKAAQKEIDKAEAEEKKKQAEEAKRKAREEAREKARKKKEAREALEISEEDEGKINKVGAGILFILFAVITLFIILGTNTYTYNLSIENAQTDFLIRHYNEAYYDVYGLQIKDEDIELYDRIMTVMYVNSQLNSYNYYMKSNNSDKALNSLIKGLEKYEKYYMLATTLGITDDLEYVKANILNELNRTFKVTEAEAYSMMNINDVIDYSEYIYALLGTYDLDSIKALT